jgi:hypothetical protein
VFYPEVDDAEQGEGPVAEPETLDDLLAIHAICQVKHRYLRCIDTKAWDELAGCFTADIEVSYGGGAKELNGRDEVVAFLQGALGSTRMLTSHRCGQPEIDLVDSTTATGMWALEDVVIHQDAGLTIHGACYYDERYRKEDGRWSISAIGYKRLYEEVWPRASLDGLRITADYWATGGRSSLYQGL